MVQNAVVKLKWHMNSDKLVQIAVTVAYNLSVHVLQRIIFTRKLMANFNMLYS